MLYIIFVFFLLITILSIFINNKFRPLCLFIGLILTLLAGFRSSSTGDDYLQYLMYIKHIDNEANIYYAVINNIYLEPFFTSLSYFITQFLNLSYIYVFLCFSILGIMLKTLAFNKYSLIPLLSLLLYFQSLYFTGDLAQIRQSVALSFFIFSCFSLNNGFVKRSYIYMIIAFLFHYSAIIGFFIFPLKIIYDRYNTVNLMRLSLIVIFSLFIFSFLKMKMSTFLGVVIPFDFISSRIISYSTSEFSKAIAFGVSDIIRLMTCTLIYLFLCRGEGKNKYIYICYMFGCILYFFLKNDGILASRATMYFKVLDCFILADLVYNVIRINGRQKYLAIALSFLFVVFYASASFFKNTIPYYSEVILL